MPRLLAEGCRSPHHSPALFFFLVAAVVLLIFLILILVSWKVKNLAELKKLVTQTKTLQEAKDFCSGNLRTVSQFDLRSLKKATKNFHPSNLLGRGGFGPVYRGKLRDGKLVAVKKLSLDKSQQGEAEFLAEVKMITSIQHKNLVRLLGCCSDGPQRLLVYEYMKNRSLDLIIYERNDQFLNWNTRFQIILGIARGLQYLHEDSHLRIVHRDIKASNILLDDRFQPRIGDFGLARFFPEDEAYLSTAFAGTLGYTAPEYAIRGELSEKADIYSFGVLVLEIIGCRKNTDRTLSSEMQYLPEYAWKLYEKSRVIDLVDPRIQEDGFVENPVLQVNHVLQVIHVALFCLQPYANLRPPMSEVVAVLTCRADMVGTPMKPAFLDRKQDKNISSDTISEAFPSPLHSDSPSSSQQPKISEVFPSPLHSDSPSSSQQPKISEAFPSPLHGDSPSSSQQPK
ncbi:cold-responsive protein kinase 1-like isoform X2 [Vitis riparia]|uniref:cold-responsive protein kinase 1-like isoform X2 n=1 Tax=Vitis riparia TaxID=96939 RepID=UPI00155B193C|nr:cold-responsive protein kinase 1-like isoform X2 [Vitis riparia]